MDGICVDVTTNSCAAVTCPIGWGCDEGKCIPPPRGCQYENNCYPGEVCIDGACVDSCVLMKCASGYICEQGSCIPACDAMNCPAGQVCSGGKCVDDQQACNYNEECPEGYFCPYGFCISECSRILCPVGTKCRKGECIPDDEICPDDNIDVHRCFSPRPNEQTCPTIFYFRAPDPNFCGITATGERINFPRECETCKD